jgi:hypothetical protein
VDRVFAISGLTREGCEPLMLAINDYLESIRPNPSRSRPTCASNERRPMWWLRSVPTRGLDTRRRTRRDGGLHPGCRRSAVPQRPRSTSPGIGIGASAGACTAPRRRANQGRAHMSTLRRCRSTAARGARCARVVVKVGSSLVTNEGRGLDAEAISLWGRQIAALRAGGKQVVMVSSGAIAEGMKRLGWAKRPHEMHELQAAAAVGQMGLAQVYETCFRAHGLQTAQVLLTTRTCPIASRYLNARSTLLTLLAAGRGADHQRERHRGHRRDQVRRQRHAGLRWLPT